MSRELLWSVFAVCLAMWPLALVYAVLPILAWIEDGE